VSPGASEVWGRNDSAAFVVQPGQPARPLRDDHGVPLPPVRHWSADGKTVWLFTIGGKLGRFRSGRLAWLDRGQGVPEIRAHVLQVGPDRSLWMTANDGLFRATIADLDAALDGRETHVSFSTYGTGDGLRSSEFNGGVPAGALDTQGRLWFPNAAGAVRVDPRRFRVNAVPPPVRIEAARVTDTLGEHDLPTQTGLTLQPGSQQLAIDYTAPSFLAPSRVQFAYQLEGMDARPVAAQTRRTAYYTGLQPGRHAFRVWATNADGIRSVHAALLDVTVLPAWYQTRAFTVACVLAVLALFWTIYTVRLRQLRARQRDLEGQVRARTADLEREKAVSESLLLNVLPASIAHRLKEGETTIADTFEEVSVLFADIVGFTVLSADSTPQAIVELLNDLFSRFDAVTERFGVEKIKTIGDAYMVVAGVPLPRADHAGTLADVALAMLDELNDFNGERGATLALRIGLHSGPVVAGVIGKRKFSYDLWGDTVNTASRMESHGVVGCIHLSEATRDRLPSRHGLEDRGLISIKGKGSMRTFLLTSGGGSTRVGAGLYVTAAGMAEPSGSLETLRSSLPSD
jgi:class 3 adenylate cyclase